MSSDTAPPSIPPRKRPTPQSGRPRPAATGVAPPLRPAGPEAELTQPAPGAAYAAFPTRETVGTAPSSVGTATQAASAAPAPREVHDPPSPLQAAVGSVTQTLKKAAAATSSAISGATHPRTEDHTMSSPTSATSPRTDTSAHAAATDGHSGPRPAPVRIPISPTTGAPRRVRLAVSRIDPWSVMKLSFLLSVAIGIMIVIATAVLWFALDSLEVFAQVDTLVNEVLGAEDPLDILQYVEFSRAISAATIVAVVDVFLLTALSTIGAFLYNITAALVGGVHLTLTDD